MREISEVEFQRINRRVVAARQPEPERIGPIIRDVLQRVKRIGVKAIGQERIDKADLTVASR